MYIHVFFQNFLKPFLVGLHQNVVCIRYVPGIECSLLFRANDVLVNRLYMHVFRKNNIYTILKAPVSTVVLRHLFTNKRTGTGQTHAGHNYGPGTSCRPADCDGPAHQPI
jgi:hypothetical protein